MRNTGEIDAWPYVEALPRFSILTLEKEWRRGARVICWYDQDGVLVGDAHVGIDDTGLDLAYAFDQTDGHVDGATGVCRLDVVRRDDGNRGERPAVICPGCEQRKEVLLFLDQQWRCRKCHKVKNLSNRLDRDTRLYISLQAYSKYVRGARPKGVHHSTYAKHVAVYKRLKKEWGNRPKRTLQRAHMFWVDERYLRPDEIPLPDGFKLPEADEVDPSDG